MPHAKIKNFYKYESSGSWVLGFLSGVLGPSFLSHGLCFQGSDSWVEGSVVLGPGSWVLILDYALKKTIVMLLLLTLHIWWVHFFL